MEIRGKDYELVDGKCPECAFVGEYCVYGGCDLDLGQMNDNESCLSSGNTDKIYKEISK